MDELVRRYRRPRGLVALGVIGVIGVLDVPICLRSCLSEITAFLTVENDVNGYCSVGDCDSGGR